MRTPITYYGGKQQLADIIISMMPAHRIYCEPYFGGGAVFFAKGASFLEAINDTNDLLITFWQQCRENFDKLQFRIQGTLDSEAEFNKARRIYNNPKYRSKLDIAWAVWVMTNMAVMATPRGGWKRDNGTNGSHFGNVLEGYRNDFTGAVYNRLKNVQISCKDALEVIPMRDTPETFFYLDPPYIGCDQKHYKGFKPKDLRALLDVLTTIKGKFILSNFFTEDLRRYVKENGWNYKVVRKESMVPKNGSKSRTKHEVLVYNYNLENNLFSNI